MIEERGTPSELAERITRLPEGQYQVFVRKARNRADVIREFKALFSDLDKIPNPETVGMTDDEIQGWVNDAIDDGRVKNRNKHDA